MVVVGARCYLAFQAYSIVRVWGFGSGTAPIRETSRCVRSPQSCLSVRVSHERMNAPARPSKLHARVQKTAHLLIIPASTDHRRGWARHSFRHWVETRNRHLRDTNLYTILPFVSAFVSCGRPHQNDAISSEGKQPLTLSISLRPQCRASM